jgi:hypothetical protein
VSAYRLYFLDGAGSVDSADWLDAADDETAVAAASKFLIKGGNAELWQGSRFVTRLDRNGAIAGGGD